MPFTGTEILEVAPGEPVHAVVIGNVIVVVDLGRTTPSGVLPLTGTFVLMNATTGNALVYTGLPTVVHPAFSNVATPMVAAAGYAWLAVNGQLWRIDPTTGSCVMMSALPTINHRTLATTGNGLIHAYSISTNPPQIYDIGSNSWSAAAAVASARTSAIGVPSANACVAFTGNSFTIYDATTGVDLSTTSIANSNRGKADVIGTKLYVPRQVAGTSSIIEVIDAVTATYATFSLGSFTTGYNVCVGPDGWLYTLHAQAQIVAVSPVTGQVDVTPLPTTRARRRLVLSAAGQLWIPSGEPL